MDSFYEYNLRIREGNPIIQIISKGDNILVAEITLYENEFLTFKQISNEEIDMYDIEEFIEYAKSTFEKLKEKTNSDINQL
jgi:hypothetical protein